jgi:hypothetical protein
MDTLPEDSWQYCNVKKPDARECLRRLQISALLEVKEARVVSTCTESTVVMAGA